MISKPTLSLALFLLLSVPQIAGAQARAKHNVLIIVADDLGVDYVAAYKEGAEPAKTSNIDALAKRGVLFRNAWASPLCSPARACFMTGRYSFRTGVGTVIRVGRRFGRGATGLPKEELTIPEVLDRSKSGYAHAAFGKWHLGDGSMGPNNAGWSHYAGMLPGTLRGAFDYDHWPRTVNGKTEICDNYATTQLVDDALAWIKARELQKKPWLCYLAFNAPHSPFHRPPAELHSQNPKELDPNKDVAACYRAMVEAMDSEIGRLLRELGPALAHSNIIFMGDNGTPNQVVKAPFLARRAKGTVYEGGINVPLIVAGPAVKGKARECKALVSITDLFATTLELCAVDYRKHLPKKLEIDAVSFVPHLEHARHGVIRHTVFTELFPGSRPEQSGQAAIRNGRYKLLRDFRGPGQPLHRLFDLKEDPFERNDLVQGDMSSVHKEQFLALKQEMERLRSTRRKN